MIMKHNLRAHIIMFMILVQLIVLDLNNNWIQRASEHLNKLNTPNHWLQIVLYKMNKYPAVVQYGLPLSVILCLISNQISKKYLSKLHLQYKSIYNKFLCLLTIITMSLISFVMMMSVYISQPES